MALNRLLSIGVALSAAVVAVGCGQVTQGTQVTTSPSVTANTPTKTTPEPTQSGFPPVGATLALAGESAGEKFQVTLTSVVDPASESDGLGLLPTGDRLVAINLTVKNVGSGIQQQSIEDNVTLIDTSGHSYNGFSGLGYSVSQCQTFSGQVTLPPGQAESGCVVFQIPSTAKLSKFQYIPDAGFASSLGEWNLG